MSLKIMVVDDDAEILRFMKSVVVPLGHQIFTFEDSQQAAERAAQQKFDVVFLDVRMPHMDGLELSRRVRATELNGETAIVMLTAMDDIELLRKAFSEGVTFFLTKPVTPARVSSMLGVLERSAWKDKRHSVRLPFWAPVVCKWHDQHFAGRCVNISESGILLQPSVEPEVGQEVLLELKIAEVHASLNVRAKIVRKEGNEKVGLQFVDLAPEDRNAIQLYIIGRLKEQSQPREESHITKPSRLWRG